MSGWVAAQDVGPAVDCSLLALGCGEERLQRRESAGNGEVDRLQRGRGVGGRERLTQDSLAQAFVEPLHLETPEQLLMHAAAANDGPTRLDLNR